MTLSTEARAVIKKSIQEALNEDKYEVARELMGLLDSSLTTNQDPVTCRNAHPRNMNCETCHPNTNQVGTLIHQQFENAHLGAEALALLNELAGHVREREGRFETLELPDALARAWVRKVLVVLAREERSRSGSQVAPVQDKDDTRERDREAFQLLTELLKHARSHRPRFFREDNAIHTAPCFDREWLPKAKALTGVE